MIALPDFTSTDLIWTGSSTVNANKNVKTDRDTLIDLCLSCTQLLWCSHVSNALCLTLTYLTLLTVSLVHSLLLQCTPVFVLPVSVSARARPGSLCFALSDCRNLLWPTAAVAED